MCPCIVVTCLYRTPLLLDNKTSDIYKQHMLKVLFVIQNNILDVLIWRYYFVQKCITLITKIINKYTNNVKVRIS